MWTCSAPEGQPSAISHTRDRCAGNHSWAISLRASPGSARRRPSAPELTLPGALSAGRLHATLGWPFGPLTAHHLSLAHSLTHHTRSYCNVGPHTTRPGMSMSRPHPTYLPQSFPKKRLSLQWTVGPASLLPILDNSCSSGTRLGLIVTRRMVLCRGLAGDAASSDMSTLASVSGVFLSLVHSGRRVTAGRGTDCAHDERLAGPAGGRSQVNSAWPPMCAA